MKLVSIVTVNFNQPIVTEALLDSLITQNQYPDIEVIVVDNGSRVSVVPEWQLRYPDVKFIRSEKNLGFAGGNNLGIAQASGDYLLLINNDTIVTPDLIPRLVESLELNPEAGVVSPKIRYYDQPDLLQYAGYTPMNLFTARNVCIGQFEKDRGQYDGPPRKTAFAHGAAMMLRKEAIKKAGLMYEHYFLYYEELDWCERIKRAGFDILMDPSALIFHKESVSVSKTTGLKEYFMNRNRILFVRKNGNPLQLAIFWIYFLIAVAPRNIASYLVSGNRNLIPVFLKAIGWHFTHAANSPELGYPLPTT